MKNLNFKRWFKKFFMFKKILKSNSPYFKNLLAVFSLVLIGFLFFSFSLNDHFLSDDYDFLTFTSSVNNWHSFKKFVVLPGSVYRPVMNFSMLVDFWIWRFNPFGYHLSNVLLHLVNSLCIYYLIIVLFKNRRMAFASSLLFAIYPAHHESVTWIAGRTDVLCTSFYLLSLLCFILWVKNKFKIFYFFSLIAFVLSLFSKEMAITLPLVLFIFSFLFFEKEKFSFKSFFKKGFYFFPYLLILLGYLWIRKLIVGSFIGGYSLFEETSFNFFLKSISWKAVLSLPLAFIKYSVNRIYLRDIISNLNIDFRIFYLHFLKIFAWLIFIFLILALLVIQIKKLSKPSFWYNLFFYYVLILTTAFPVYSMLTGLHMDLSNTRFLYLPSFAFCVLLGYLFFGRIGDKNERFIKAGIFTILILFFSTVFFINYTPWAQASSTASKMLVSLRKFPQFEDKQFKGMIYFLNIPDSIWGAYVFRNGFEPAVGFEFQNPTLFGNYQIKRVVNVKISKDSVDRYCFSNYNYRFKKDTYLLEWNAADKEFKERNDLLASCSDKESQKRLHFKEIKNFEWNFSSAPVTEWTSPKIQLPACLFNKLEIEMISKSSRKAIGHFYWATEENKDFSENFHHMLFPVNADTQFQRYEIPLSSCLPWLFSGNIENIKVFLEKGDLIQITRISLK